MKISHVEIQNYRKLKCCRISFTGKETLFVGANNSGKTSAMDALIYFLEPKGKKSLSDSGELTGGNRRILTTDFTLSNWNQINSFVQSWLDDSVTIGNSLKEWQPLCPSLDVWLDVKENEVHKVSHLIPTLKWDGGLLGVRLIFQPKNIQDLKSDFFVNYNAAKELLEKVQTQTFEDGPVNDGSITLTLWPKTLRDFLDKELSKHFELKSYILDPAKIEDEEGNPVKPQLLSDEIEPLPSYPFNRLFKVDIIDAQRGFSDPNSVHSIKGKSSGNLSAQLNKYYNRHLNPSELPGEGDLDALHAINEAKTLFDKELNEAFKDTLGEIKGLGYPGFNDPEIRLSSKVEPVENLDHEAAIQFDIQKQALEGGEPVLALPEKYNGLGYKNLIAMVFRLISFRDQWMMVGKAGMRRTEEDVSIEPLHIVLIEEPEAHLHAQVQQVFIRKAYEVLRNHISLRGDKSKLSTQMVVSTHSSYLAHEVGFEKLRYFKRESAGSACSVPTATVADLSETFGEKRKRKNEIQQTAQFVARYLKTTHCDLFFANGIILVEGAAERILLPHFIRNNQDHKKGLNRNYISVLEVGGAHAHRLKPLIDKLGLPTLVITDTDSVGSDGTKQRPQRGKSLKSGSDTIGKWFGLRESALDEILDLPFESKVLGHVRAAYQYGIKIKSNDVKEAIEVIPYTFEDAIALTNAELFKTLKNPTGMIKKMQQALNNDCIEECCEGLFNALKEDKAKMALDLLFDVDPEQLKVPEYIEEGLTWLETELEIRSKDFVDPPCGCDTEANSHE